MGGGGIRGGRKPESPFLVASRGGEGPPCFKPTRRHAEGCAQRLASTCSWTARAGLAQFNRSGGNKPGEEILLDDDDDDDEDDDDDDNDNRALHYVNGDSNGRRRDGCARGGRWAA